MRFTSFIILCATIFCLKNQASGQVVQYQKSVAFFKHHRYDSARVCAQASIRGGYANYRPHLLLAKIALIEHDTSVSMSYCDSANALSEHCATLLQAQIATAQKKDSLAFEYLQKVQSSSYGLSEYDLLQLQWTKALRKSKKWDLLIELTYKNKEQSFASRCEILYKHADYVALDQLADSAIAATNWSSAHWYKSIAWKALGDSKIEQRELLIAVKSKDINGEYWLALSHNYSKNNNYTKAINALQHAITLLPDSIHLYYLKTKFLVLNKQYQDAKNEIATFLQIEPQNDTAWYMAGMIETEQKHTLAALPYLNKAIEINPYQPEYYKCRGNTLFDCESFELAERNFSLAMDVAPTDGTLYFNRGLCRYRLQKQQLACLDFTRAFELGVNAAYQYLSKTCNK